MKKYHINAVRLRILLSVSLFVIVAIAGIIASLAYNGLKETAVDVSHTTVDASASQNNLQTLQQIQQKLAGEKDTIDRANSIVADSKSYLYQDQILADLNDYASKAGVTIMNIEFSSSTETGATGQTPKTTPVAPVPTGVKSTAVTVTLKNPISYNNLLQFMKSIEQNLTKMQISKVGLSKSTDGNDVTSDILALEVYVR